MFSGGLGPKTANPKSASDSSRTILAIDLGVLAIFVRQLIDETHRGGLRGDGASYGMLATVDEAGVIEDFIALGLTDGERRHMAGWPSGQAFFEHLCALPGPLRVTDLPAYLRGLGFTEEFTLSKTLQATPRVSPRERQFDVR